MQKSIVKTKTKDGEDVVLAVLMPSAQVKQQGRRIHAKEFREAVQGGAMMREELDNVLRRSNLWDDQRQAEFDRIRKHILDGELKLVKKGIKLSEAKKVAIEISKHRLELQELLSQRNRIDSNTADAIAEQAQFNYYVAACTVYDDGRWEGKPYFTSDGEHPSLDAYVEHSSEEAAIAAATKLSEMIYGTDKDMIKKLPENQFLLRFKFVDEDLHLINEKGSRVDAKGRLVDDEGRYIDEQGNYVDEDGHPVDKDGRYVENEHAHFLDDAGNPIVEETSPAPEAATPPREEGQGRASKGGIEAAPAATD